MKINFLKKKSIKSKWLISYLLILIIPLILHGSVYFAFEQKLRTEIEKSNQWKLTQLRKELDNAFDVSERICTDLAFNSHVKALLSSKNLSEKWELEQKVFDAVNSTVRPYEDVVDDVFIYYYDTDLIVSEDVVNNSLTYYSMNHNYSTEGYQEWKDFLKDSRKNNRFVFFPETQAKGNGKKEIGFFREIPLNAKENSGRKAVIVSVLKESRILSHLNEVEIGSYSAFAILGENQEVFLADSDKSAEKIRKATTNGKGTDEVVSTLSSGSRDWKYIISVNKTVYWNNIALLRVLLLFYIIFVLIFGSIMIVALVNNSYIPVLQLMEKFNLKQKDNGAANEFSAIMEKASALISEHNSMNRELRSNEDKMRRFLITQILTGQANDSSLIKRQGEEVHVTFRSEKFAVAMFDIDDLDALFAEDNLDFQQRSDYYRFIITNVVEEMLESEFDCYVTQMNNCMVALIGVLTENDAQAAERLCALIKETVTWIEKNFGITVGVAISNIYSEFNNVLTCYYEASTLNKMMQANNIFEVMSYNELSASTESKWYNGKDMEFYLCNYIKVGNEEKAKSFFEEFISKTSGEGNKRIEFVRCYMFNFLNAMFNTFESEINSHSEFSREKYAAGILNSDSTSYILKLMQEAAGKLCSYVIEDVDQSATLVSRIKEYVSENFSNYDFGVAKVGKHFNLTPSYVSKQFKEKTNILLVDYIARVRVNEAKKLFENENKSIDRVATEVGYLNSKSLARAFKRIEGVLPGEYKDMIRNSKGGDV